MRLSVNVVLKAFLTKGNSQITQNNLLHFDSSFRFINSFFLSQVSSCNVAPAAYSVGHPCYIH